MRDATAATERRPPQDERIKFKPNWDTTAKRTSVDKFRMRRFGFCPTVAPVVRSRESTVAGERFELSHHPRYDGQSRHDVAMAIVGIDHVQLAMPAGREDEARQFYGRLLGIPEVAKPPDLAKRGGVWFESAGVKIHLGVDPEFRPARKAHPALRVKGLRALADRLRDASVAVVEDEPLGGDDRVYASDPFGNRIELIESRSD